MPLQITTNKRFDKAGYITRDQVSTMVDHYRNERRLDDRSLKLAHFTVLEILDLFIANGAIAKLPQEQRDTAANFGVKIYAANHAGDPDTCPSGREVEYLNSDTVVICNTKLDQSPGKKRWLDLLDAPSSVSLPGAGVKQKNGAGEGLDRGSICPPDCPGTPDADGFDRDDISEIA